MNLAHIHLILNHMPVVGLFFAILLLVFGMFRRSAELTRAALLGLVIIALLTIPAFLTGEPAEKAIENLPAISKGAIEKHEEAAEVAFWAVEGLGMLALAGLVLYRGVTGIPRWFTTLLLACGLLVGGLMAYTANLGGQIRHPEIASGTVAVGLGEHERD